MCLLNGRGKSNGFTSVSSNGRSVVDIVLLVIRSYTISLIFLFQEALSFISTILIV